MSSPKNTRLGVEIASRILGSWGVSGSVGGVGMFMISAADSHATETEMEAGFV